MRWVMAAAGLTWEQVGLDTQEQFLHLRDVEKCLLFGQLPVLEIDGLQLVQSQAMLRYVARREGLSPVEPSEAVLCDMVAESIDDARSLLIGAPFASDKAAHLTRLPGLFDKYFPRFEGILAKSTAGTVLPSGNICYADVLLAELLHGYSQLSPGCLQKYPVLQNLMDKILAMPSIKEYLNDPKRRYPYPEGEVAVAYTTNVNLVLGR